MHRRIVLTALALGLGLLAASDAFAGGWGRCRSCSSGGGGWGRAWGGAGSSSYGSNGGSGYYHVMWGSPVNLVVPPTAEYHTEMGWGVGNSRRTVIRDQFGYGYADSFGGGYMATPAWPSDTTQFGVHYVRGPW